MYETNLLMKFIVDHWSYLSDLACTWAGNGHRLYTIQKNTFDAQYNDIVKYLYMSLIYYLYCFYQ